MGLRLVGEEVQADDWGGEHPIEIARRAIYAAADLEDGSFLADALRRVARSLPERPPLVRSAADRRGPQEAAEEFLPVVIENDREIGRRDRVNVCSTYEQAAETAAEQAARMRATEPTARAAVLRRRVGPWEIV